MRQTLGLLAWGAALACLASGFTAQEKLLESGLEIGKVVPAFNPHHVAGPDKGTSKCPP